MSTATVSDAVFEVMEDPPVLVAWEDGSVRVGGTRLLALLGSGFYFVQWAYSRDVMDLIESAVLLVVGVVGVRPVRRK